VKPVIFHQAAENELHAAVAYYQEQSQGLGVAFSLKSSTLYAAFNMLHNRFRNIITKAFSAVSSGVFRIPCFTWSLRIISGLLLLLIRGANRGIGRVVLPDSPRRMRCTMVTAPVESRVAERKHRDFSHPEQARAASAPVLLDTTEPISPIEKRSVRVT